MNQCVHVVTAAALCLAVGSVAGCRQPDGQIPLKEGEQINKTEDISRDLQNIAGKTAGAAGDLREDLVSMSSSPPPGNLSQDLTTALDGALAGKKLPDDEAKKLADTLFVVITARDLNRKQIEQINTQLTEDLKKIGVEEPAVQQVTTAAYKLQSQVTTNQKRWYHLF